MQPVRLGKLSIVPFGLRMFFEKTFAPNMKSNFILIPFVRKPLTKPRIQAMELKRRRVDADLVLSSSDEG